jgi:hypothetical protein
MEPLIKSHMAATTAGCASNESVRHHDLRRAPGDHLILDSNVVHGGLDQRFPISVMRNCLKDNTI